MVNLNSMRLWKILSWNVRGSNSPNCWRVVRSKISETSSDIICLQETKKPSIHIAFIKLFCPPSFDEFLFCHQLALLVGQLLFGEEIDSKVNWISKMTIFTEIYLHPHGVQLNFRECICSYIPFD
jgi:hypothetical protein